MKRWFEIKVEVTTHDLKLMKKKAEKKLEKFGYEHLSIYDEAILNTTYENDDDLVTIKVDVNPSVWCLQKRLAENRKRRSCKMSIWEEAFINTTWDDMKHLNDLETTTE